MKRASWVLGVLVCGLGSASGCSSDGGDDGRCTGDRCSGGRAQAVAMGAPGDPASAMQPPASTDFGNASQPVAPPPPPAPGGDTLVPVAGGGGAECEDGVFCVPDGPDGGCGQIRFDADVEVIVTKHPGNVLLVFDRSSSMSGRWNGQARWQAAGDAIRRALEPLQADLAQVGSVFFPTPGEGCVDPTGISCVFVPDLTGLGCAVEGSHPSQIGFTAGDQFLQTFSTGAAGGAPPYAPEGIGLTPLMEGLQQAEMVLAGATLEGATAVVVITDGEPNCGWNAGVANGIVSGWRDNGIQTHVIGLPGVGPGAGEAVLNALAQAGGTDRFVTPADPAALEAQLAMIVSETVQMNAGFNSCEIDLSPAAQVPDKLLMIVEEPGAAEKRQVPRSFGWSLNAAGDHVSIMGQLCDEAMGGRFTSITFEYACPDSPPPPEIPPLQ